MRLAATCLTILATGDISSMFFRLSWCYGFLFAGDCSLLLALLAGSGNHSHQCVELILAEPVESLDFATSIAVTGAQIH